MKYPANIGTVTCKNTATKISGKLIKFSSRVGCALEMTDKTTANKANCDNTDVYGLIMLTFFGNLHFKNNPKKSGMNTIHIMFNNNAQKSIGINLPMDSWTSDGVSSGEITVSSVAIVMLNATSPPAMNVYRFADVPLGTVPAKMIPEAISGLFRKKANAMAIVTPTMIVHFNANPMNAYFGCLITVTI